jgi:hypothetical protein
MSPRPRAPRPPSWLPAALIGILVQAGCAPAGSGDVRLGPGAPRLVAELPDGAIPIGSELYMLPIGRDEDGCMMYQLHAPRGMVIQAIHYRTAAGSFTLDKQDADCRLEE